MSNIERNHKSFFLNPVTENEVTKIIKSFNSSKASGPNSIPIQILKENSNFFSVS